MKTPTTTTTNHCTSPVRPKKTQSGERARWTLTLRCCRHGYAGLLSPTGGEWLAGWWHETVSDLEREADGFVRLRDRLAPSERPSLRIVWE